MLSKTDKDKMLAVHQIGPTMVKYLEMVGINSFEDLKRHSAQELQLGINAVLGKQHINAAGLKALQNLILAAHAAE